MSENNTVAHRYYPTATEREEIYERGYNFWNQGYFHHAAECFAELAIRHPLDRRFIYAFACVLEQQGETQHALKLFIHALALKTDDPFACFHIACCLKALGQVIEARDALEETLALCHQQDNDNFDYAGLHQRATELISDL